MIKPSPVNVKKVFGVICLLMGGNCLLIGGNYFSMNGIYLPMDRIYLPIDGIYLPIDGIYLPIDGNYFSMDGIYLPMDRNCFSMDENYLSMGGNYCNGQSITIITNDSVSYYPLQLFKNARNLLYILRDLVNDVINANEEGIGVEGSEFTGVEGVINLVLASITGGVDVTDLPDSDRRKQSLALASWELQKGLGPHNIDPAIYCLNKFNGIAPTVSDRARLLLLSQCGPDFTPLEDADWEIIGDAISMLMEEKDGETAEVGVLLQILKDTGCYETLLGDMF